MRSTSFTSCVRPLGRASRFGCASLALAAAVVLAGAGCSRSEEHPPEARTPQMVATVPLAPAGLSFHARLDRPLTSEDARAGQRFTAHLEEPLVSSSGGTEIAPAGSELHGRVLEVDRMGVNRLTIQFDGLMVHGRMHPIDAQVVRIDEARVVAADAADPSTLQAFVYPILPGRLPTPQVGGGPPPEAVPVVVPRGAQIQLVLSRPFGLLLAGDQPTTNE